MDTTSVLIIEDERKIADTLKLGLSEHGYLVEVAYDGLSGKTLYLTKRFDLIILDINLPGINGFDLCKFIRGQNNNVIVIMLTSKSRLDDKIDGYNAGADDYIVKPFEFKELLLKMKALLKHSLLSKGQGSHLLKIADLEMNLDNMEVNRAGQRIVLTDKEFQLLEYMLRNKNCILSRADIAINVWDIDFDTNTNVIDVYISYLRNKVDKPFDRKLIQTYIGRGYIIRENLE